MKDKCKDCTNDKGCINCEGGNMHEVKKKKPEGVLKELLDNIDPIEYEKTRREMLKEAACEDLEKAVQAYSNLYNDECFDAIGNECPYIKNAFKAGAQWQKERMIGKAVQWLEENLAKETSVIGNGNVKINFRGAINAFKKAMEYET